PPRHDPADPRPRPRRPRPAPQRARPRDPRSVGGRRRARVAAVPTTGTRMNTTRGTGLALAGCTAAISGVAVYVNSNGVRAFGDAPAYTTAKNTVAAILLVGIALAVARGHGAERPRLPRSTRGWVGLGAIGLVGGSVPFVLFFEGLA